MPHLCLPSQSVRPVTKRAFTLVELLTVIAIIGILAAILIPVVGRVRENARTSNCIQNLKGIGNAFQLYAADNRGLYPALRKRADTDAEYPGQVNPTGNWQEELSPYQSRTVADISKLNADSDSYVFCPEFVARYQGDPGWKKAITTSAGYGMNAGLGVANVYYARFRANQIVHPARTVLVGDSGNYHIDLTVSKKWKPSATAFGGYGTGDPVRHRGNANYLFADGHTATLSPDAALDVIVNRPAN